MSTPQRPLVLVTGAAQRIGKAVITAFADAGYDCLIHANRSHEAALALQDDLRTRGVQADVLLHAITDAKLAARTLLDHCEQQLGRLPQASVLCAASYDLDQPAQATLPDVTAQLELNFVFPTAYCADLGWRLSQQAARLAAQQSLPDTSVTLFTDYKVERLNGDFLSYSVAKHALHGNLPYLCVAYAPYLRVNAIAPGPVLAAHGMTQEALDALVDASSVSGHHPRIQDVAATAVFLASNPSLYGQHIVVDAAARYDRSSGEVCL
ncbi:SDR family oxidoreductase [Curvibacter sp. CHRR-16]|uniref:SDR family oxidoreductase n=1 Tax=Curvibacter sp. CHRR-16 TaxID=2835872 RepID=UPI001BD96754|nr:SDR family oxidoreductase [Curvibacter sp. CHRR-16]MBT0568833.1 SDR family oxidoreductase [Curvibacter sp. CHRR-16]